MVVEGAPSRHTQPWEKARPSSIGQSNQLLSLLHDTQQSLPSLYGCC